MSTAQVEAQLLEVLRTHSGALPARKLSASLKKDISEAQRREALQNLVHRQEVQITSDLTVKVKDQSLANRGVELEQSPRKRSAT